MALSWPGLTEQTRADAAQEVAELDGQYIVKEGNKAGEIRWRFRLQMRAPAIDINLSEPPGFSRLGLDGFTLRAPARGNWGLSFKTDVQANVRVWVARTKTPVFSWSPRLPLGIRGSAVRIVGGVDLDASAPDRPTVERVTLSPQLSIRGTGLIPFFVPFDDFTVAIEGGGVSLTKRITSLSIGLGSLTGKLTTDLAVRITPTDSSGKLLAERVGFLRVQVLLKGTLAIKLPRVVRMSLPFSLRVRVPLLVPQALLLAFGDLDVDVPRAWGEGHERGATPLPPVGVDFETAAAECENAIKTHMPFGAVLAIDRRPAPTASGLLGRTYPPIPTSGGTRRGSQPPRRRIDVPVVGTYGVELDSSIWTGHYLAAEAFRYAAEPGEAALERVRSVLDGLQWLFDVTTHAAVKGNRKVGVRERGLFARTAMPRDHQPTYTDGPLEGRFAYYEFAEGGWDLMVTGRRPHFATYAEAESARTQTLRGSLPGTTIEIRPVGRVWHGAGCGGDCEADHPISRDQYVGVFFGLFCAHQLVTDDGVRDRAALMLSSALHFLLRNGWNVPLPPEKRICTTFIGQYHQQLAFLAMGRAVNPAEFGTVYEEYQPAAAAAWLPMWASALDPIPKYFKFNLQHATILPALLAEPSGAIRDHYMVAYRILRRATAHHRNAYFNLARILVEPPITRGTVADSPSGSNGEIALRDEIKSLLADWLDRRNKVPGPTGLPLNNVADPAFQAALWPEFVQRYRELGASRRGSYMATFALPPNGRVGEGMDFMWQRHPFGVAIRSNRRSGDPPPSKAEIIEVGAGVHKYREGAGVDYLLAYWLAVYLGILP